MGTGIKAGNIHLEVTPKNGSAAISPKVSNIPKASRYPPLKGLRTNIEINPCEIVGIFIEQVHRDMSQSYSYHDQD
jgi:hypothetical protein